MYNLIKNEYNNINRIIIIGDVHGDLKRFKKILIDAKIINNKLEWIAEPPNTIVVQLGDQIDSLNRVPGLKEWETIKDIEMLYFTDSLDKIARSYNGRLISLIGNHELMNVLGDFSYVSKNSNYEWRDKSFNPDGNMTQLLLNRPLVLKINDLLFSHSKFSLDHYNLLKKYNKDIYYVNELWKKLILRDKNISSDDLILINELILGSNGILWNRDANIKKETEELYNLIKCRFSFVGHTQSTKINLIDEQIWYCDTGLSRSFGYDEFLYLDINNFNISIKKINDI